MKEQYQPPQEETEKAKKMTIDTYDTYRDGRGYESKQRTPGIEKIIAPIADEGARAGYVIIRKDGAKLFYTPAQRTGPAGWQWDTCVNRAEQFQKGIIPDDCTFEASTSENQEKEDE